MSIVDKVTDLSSISNIYQMLQVNLKREKSRNKEEEIKNDKIREGSIIFLGTMAKQLLPEDPKVI